MKLDFSNEELIATDEKIRKLRETIQDQLDVLNEQRTDIYSEHISGYIESVRECALTPEKCYEIECFVCTNTFGQLMDSYYTMTNLSKDCYPSFFEVCGYFEDTSLLRDELVTSWGLMSENRPAFRITLSDRPTDEELLWLEDWVAPYYIYGDFLTHHLSEDRTRRVHYKDGAWHLSGARYSRELHDFTGTLSECILKAYELGWTYE